MRLYKLHDTNPNGAIEIKPSDAQKAQSEGYGIFQLVNSFNGPRKLENLTKINAWYCEIDHKPKLSELIQSLPIHPTVVNESARGYHLYFYAKDASIKRFKLIQKRICKLIGGDQNAIDAARILRAPGYYHLKDPANPFLIKTVWEYPVSFREVVMLQALPPHPDESVEIAQPPEKRLQPSGDSFSDKIWSCNQGDLLLRLSGHSCVSGERFELVKKSGRLQIKVDGETIGCWIDNHGRIGSTDNGGPGVVNWLMWYGHSYKEAMDYLKEIFWEFT